jgi:hypothetical protein
LLNSTRRFTVRIAVCTVLASCALLFQVTLHAQSTRILRVDKLTAKVGDIVTATGVAMDKANMDTLYLTDGSKDIKVDMTEQTDKEIKFKVPEQAKSHRWALMVRTTTTGQLMEEPVKVTVE